MQKAEVIYNRNLINSLTYTTKNEDGTEITMMTPIAVFGSNNFNMITDYHDGSMIWDDSRETIFFFQYNSKVDMNAPSMAMSPGSRPVSPCLLSIMPYNEIITMRAILIEETFDKVCNQLGITGDAYDKLYHKFFVETDQLYQIQQKRKISYSSQHSKEWEKNRHYTEMDEYNKTVHPTIL